MFDPRGNDKQDKFFNISCKSVMDTFEAMAR